MSETARVTCLEELTPASSFKKSLYWWRIRFILNLQRQTEVCSETQQYLKNIDFYHHLPRKSFTFLLFSIAVFSLNYPQKIFCTMPQKTTCGMPFQVFLYCSTTMNTHFVPLNFLPPTVASFCYLSTLIYKLYRGKELGPKLLMMFYCLFSVLWGLGGQPWTGEQS